MATGDRNFSSFRYATSDTTLTAILIAHSELLSDVEEAFALTDLPADCARLRTAFAELHVRQKTL